ncbi:FixH family protein [Chitinimonas viridis]|uniref:FixH family protein n=1 Tax=Chitinimonas viridis TaxID=664880 RepID=A0ABT8B636_9NEIS|nr:FixH family protein [Chitinimonas viridis]MDN3577018.1 FixH family protein [Chitinimonas viridis]
MSDSNRWYRQPVVLLFLGLLLVTVLACIHLIKVAIQSNDGLVVDDYYKRGNEIGMEMARDQQASALGLSAQLFMAEDGQSVRVLLVPLPASPAPLKLRFAHPTRSGLDQVVTLQPVDGAMLSGRLASPLVSQRWLVQLEDEAAKWRLRAEAKVGPGATLGLSSTPATAAPVAVPAQ